MSGTHPPGVPDADLFARTLVAEATRVEAAELVIKNEVLAAARKGDCARVMDIVSRWLTEPPVALAATLIDASESR
jgi:hypothetical protein